MSILRRDVCDLKSPGVMVQDVGPAVIQRHLSSALQYSCRYWLDHSEHGQLSLNDGRPVHRFFKEYCPYWLEAMSLVGKMPEAMIMMTLNSSARFVTNHLISKTTLYLTSPITC